MGGQLAGLNKAWLNKLAPRGSAKVLRIQGRTGLGATPLRLYTVHGPPYLLDSPVPS